jgi:hypothetical protein
MAAAGWTQIDDPHVGLPGHRREARHLPSRMKKI